MVHPDHARQRLRNIIDEFNAFCGQHGTVSEADTRAKVITRVLTQVCCWPEGDIEREKFTDAGRMDYQLRVFGKAHVVVEAKREGAAFNLPVDGARKTYQLDGTLVSDPETKAAIIQVRNYCDEEGIRYAIATNGDAWIVFRAVRDDSIGWKKGHARVFRSLESIYEHFTEFWNLLSFNAISSGSLNSEFSTTLRASRELHRVGEKLFNADLILERNYLSQDLQPLIKLVFEDIANQEELDVLKQCYIHTGTLRHVANDLNRVLTETIPAFLVREGARTIGHDAESQGFLQQIKNVVNISKGELFLLLGGIGCGKSTFLKRYHRAIGANLLSEKTMWFSVDFIQPPDQSHMEQFIWQGILDTIRSRYKEFNCEKRRHIKEVFANDIEAIQGLLPSGNAHEVEFLKILKEWSTDLGRYVPGLVRVSCVRLKRKPVIFIDNVDQLSPDYQAQIYLLAQRVTGLIGSITVVVLREESYYTANIMKVFSAYSNRKFHIASPVFTKMIANRIEYAQRRLQDVSETATLSVGEEIKRDAILDFLTLVKGAIVSTEKDRIKRFIKSICYGNMRLGLQMFCTFITSGAIDVAKMLKIHRRDGWYDIAYHEFVKAIMLADRAYYKEEQSPILNIFNVGSEPRSSHFTSWRILSSLIAHRGVSTVEGIGYVELSRILVEFENTFDNAEDFLAAMNRLVAKKLIEPNTRSIETVKGASHVRVTSSGIYYLRYLIHTFAYLDLVLQDTPLNDSSLEYDLRQSVYQVNNLADNEEEKLERVRARFLRVRLFLDYLKKEEDFERTEYSLANLDTPIAQPIVPAIRSELEKEMQWIEKRILQNRERFKEEFIERRFEDEVDSPEEEDSST